MTNVSNYQRSNIKKELKAIGIPIKTVAEEAKRTPASVHNYFNPDNKITSNVIHETCIRLIKRHYEGQVKEGEEALARIEALTPELS